MARFRVGIQLPPQHTTIEQLRAAWREADQLGVDSIWTWDHFFPLYGDPEGIHFECWSLMAAMAIDTSNAQFGALVTCNTYRNPDLLADMARTVSQLSGGRLILGIGAGWFERDYTEYGYEFGTAGSRLRALEEGLQRIKNRLSKLNPPPQRLPILIGGSGEKVTLRLVAEHADLWNSFGPPEEYARKNGVLNDWCKKVGRDPAAVERTVTIHPDQFDTAEGLAEAGAQHLILAVPAPFDFTQAKQLLQLARS